MEENRECALPEEVQKLYLCYLLGETKTWMDENRIMHTIYSYPKDLNGDNKGQDYGMDQNIRKKTRNRPRN
jgi:hypothetical protein